MEKWKWRHLDPKGANAEFLVAVILQSKFGDGVYRKKVLASLAPIIIGAHYQNVEINR